MLIIPAIDLKDGQCVRLKQGLMEQATVFSESPADQARHWLEQGARRLHLVDLDGAFAGKPKNQTAIKAILKEVGDKIPVQLGGGSIYLAPGQTQLARSLLLDKLSAVTALRQDQINSTLDNLISDVSTLASGKSVLVAAQALTTHPAAPASA